jgi:predicted lipoprotein
VAATFNATQFAETFWTSQLLASLDKAVTAKTLLPAIQSDAAAAKKKFARSLGLSEGYFYFLRGEGKILSVTDDEVSIAVTDGSTNAEISLQTGLIFGNALRDGTGLLSPSDYPNSQDYNDISAALNHIVETSVQPKLRERARIDGKISFAGCAEVNDESADLKPLKVIPIQVKIE